MSRSIGVTISAVLVLLGSLFWLLVSSLALVFQPTEPPLSSALRYANIFAPLSMVLSSVWGVLTAIGLFRLKRWARISLLIFAVLLVYAGAVTVVVMLLATLPAQLSEEQQSLSRTVGVVIFSPAMGIGIWWLYLFNKASVKAQFPKAERVSGSPISITVIAVFMIWGAIAPLLMGVFGRPTIFFGFIVTGWPASLISMIMAILSFYVGYGLLRLSDLSRKVAIGYMVYAMANSLSFLVLPGFGKRMAVLPGVLEMAGEGTPAMSTGLIVLMNLSSLIIFAIALWFLVTRKQAFISGEETPPSTSQPQPM